LPKPGKNLHIRTENWQKREKTHACVHQHLEASTHKYNKVHHFLFLAILFIIEIVFKKTRLTYTARYDVKPCELKASCVVELNKSKINGTLSSIESCRARVPQGSVLSPTFIQCPY
jgi:hypothetical protein